MSRAPTLIVAALLAVAFARGARSETPQTRVMQGIAFKTWATRNSPDTDSPAYPLVAGNPEFASNSLVDYTLRFISNGASATSVAEGTINEQGVYDGKILQAWCGVSLADGWALNVGKKIVKWQDGVFTNPSDVVNGHVSFAHKGEREGRLLSEVNGVLPLGDTLTLDLSGVVPLDPAIGRVQDLPAYFACGTMLYPFEIRAKGGFQSGTAPVAGLALKASIIGCQWYADSLYSRESDISAIAREKDDYFRFCSGVTGTIPLVRPYADGIDFAFEFAYRNDGLTKDEGVTFMNDPVRLAGDPAFRLYDEYERYGFAKLTLGNIGSATLDWSETWYLNLVDPSGSIESKLEWSPKKVFTIDFAYTFRHGESSSEIAAFASRHQFELSFSREF